MPQAPGNLTVLVVDDDWQVLEKTWRATALANQVRKAFDA